MNSLHLRMHCCKFCWNWPSGSGEEDKNVKSLRQQRRRRRTPDKLWSEKLTWAYGSGELKKKTKKFFLDSSQLFLKDILHYSISQHFKRGLIPLQSQFCWLLGLTSYWQYFSHLETTISCNWWYYKFYKTLFINSLTIAGIVVHRT